MANVANTIKAGRIPWASEPKCITCHTGVTGVETGNDLYHNSHGHGNLYCTACHGSPHAMYPSRESKDNFQPNQYQGSKIKTIGSCGTCHSNSKGEGAGGEFAEEHGGTNPGKRITATYAILQFLRLHHPGHIVTAGKIPTDKNRII